MIRVLRHPERSEGSSYGSSLVVIPDLFGVLLANVILSEVEGSREAA